jgi:hypothetical protein
LLPADSFREFQIRPVQLLVESSSGKYAVCQTMSQQIQCTGGMMDKVEMFGEVPNLSKPLPYERKGDTYLRPAFKWTPTTHALLRHLHQNGFTACPEVVGTGFAPDGREILSWVDGKMYSASPWPDMETTMWELGGLMRQLHEVTASFVPPKDAIWMPWALHERDGDVISHCNIAPWNVVFIYSRSLRIINWEYAGPTSRLNELSVTGWYTAHLHDDDVAELEGLPDAETRITWLKNFLDGYRLPRSERRGLVTRMIEFAVRDTAGFARSRKITPESKDPEPLWLLSWQIRAADWLLRHRSQIENSI